MSLATIENDDGVLSTDQNDSPSIDRGKNGGSAGGGTTLKKGPWTSAEDSILIDYVKKHGEGNWNAVQKFSGLSRCGKSCRLRWANHLRPNLKKGAFSAEEERLIVELHAKMGNKWARMAAHLPGRTDNEIKNYWNTRIKRRQRAGIPLYPAELCMQGMQDGQQGQNCGINNGNKGHDVLQGSIYEVPDVVFDSLRSHQGIVHYVPELPEVSTGSLFMRGFGSSQYGSFVSPTMHRQKRLRESPSFYPGYGIKHDFPSLHSFQEDSCNRIAQSHGYSYPDDCDNSNKNLLSFGVVQGGHSLSNGIHSASKPNFGALKRELPSLQFSGTDLGSWETPPSPPTVLESVDNYIQSPPRTGNIELESVSPRNSGLLDALVYGAKSTNSAKNYASDKSSYSSTLTPGDISSSTLDVCKTEWDDYGDPISPLGHSATSIFSECTPMSASGSSMDEPPSSDSFSVYNVKSEPFNQDQFPEKCEIMRPDALLGSDWFGPSSEPLKDQEPMSESIAVLLADGLYDNYKQSAEAYTTDQGWGFGSCPWNNLPSVCQMSELP